MVYLLLRDNKQSGPYSLDDLKVKGLKAYDLVWVEGRSAAWRYPSEIEELRAWAPAVEEQPFDRFYKKPAAAQQANGSASLSTGQAVEMPANTAVVTLMKPATATNPTTIKRTIYVTMPGGIAARENVREGKEVSPPREVIREIAPVREAAFPIRERLSYVPEPVSEILPPLPKRKQTKILMPVVITGAVLVLLASGIFIGMSIQKESPGSRKLASRDTKDTEQRKVKSAAQQVPVVPSPGNSDRKDSVSNGGVVETNNKIAVTDKPVVRPRTAKQKTDLPKTQPAPAISPVTTVDSQAIQVASRREAVHRTDDAQNQPAGDREGVRVALANEVSVGSNKYDVGTFGGIHNLQITVTNRSAYSLDQVVVAVSYIQANKKTYKTENLYFRGIGPGSALMLEAPKSSRGISVQYKVTSIHSKELGLSQPGT